MTFDRDPSNHKITNSKFYAQKQILKKKTNMFEMDLEKDIMTSGNCEFIVRLHGTLTDLDYYYFLMGKLFVLLLISAEFQLNCCF